MLSLIFTAVIPPTVGCVSLTRSEATNSYEVNTYHNETPSLCRVLPEEEINGGNPYTMTVELMNVISSKGVNFGHPGVMYNVVDENNFDFVYIRLVLCGFHVSTFTSYKVQIREDVG